MYFNRKTLQSLQWNHEGPVTKSEKLQRKEKKMLDLDHTELKTIPVSFVFNS